MIQYLIEITPALAIIFGLPTCVTYFAWRRPEPEEEPQEMKVEGTFKLLTTDGEPVLLRALA